MDANTVIWILLVIIFILSVFLGAAITCCRIYESKWKKQRADNQLLCRFLKADHEIREAGSRAYEEMADIAKAGRRIDQKP